MEDRCDHSPWSTATEDLSYRDFCHNEIPMDGLENPPPSRAPSHRTEVYPPNQVLVNVYEVAGFGRLNRLMSSKEVPIGGAMHAGVEVYGHEWSYGGGPGHGSGVICEHPRQNKQHRFRETVVLAKTPLTHSEVAEVVADLLDSWPAEQYHWLRRNCLAFANELCERLGVGRMPEWIDRFARGAGAVDRGFSMIAESAVGVAEGARFIVDMLYGNSVCGQCTKMPAATSLSLNVVEQLAATGSTKPSGRKGPSSAFGRSSWRVSQESLFEPGAFAIKPMVQQPKGLHSGSTASSSRIRGTLVRPESDDDSADGWEASSPSVPSEAPAHRPAATMRSRPEEPAAVSRRQVPPVPMIGVMQEVESPSRLSPRDRSSPCSVSPSRRLFNEPSHLSGRIAAPPTMRRDLPCSPTGNRLDLSPPPPPR